MSIRVTDDKLEVRFTRTERAVGILRDVVVPLSAVRDVEVVPSGLAATRGLRAPGYAWPGRRKLLLEHLGFALQISPQHPRPDPGEEQDEAEIAESIRNRVGQRRVGGQQRLRVRGNRQLGDRAQAGAERC